MRMRSPARPITRLIKKNNNERRDRQRNHQVAEPYRENGQSTRRNWCGRLLLARSGFRGTGLFQHAIFIIRAMLPGLKLVSRSPQPIAVPLGLLPPYANSVTITRLKASG